LIVNNSGAEYAKIGIDVLQEPKFQLQDISNPGVYEIELGLSVYEL
jgi:NADH-quinone oxidoreductase subunit F